MQPVIIYDIPFSSYVTQSALWLRAVTEQTLLWREQRWTEEEGASRKRRERGETGRRRKEKHILPVSVILSRLQNQLSTVVVPLLRRTLFMQQLSPRTKRISSYRRRAVLQNQSINLIPPKAAEWNRVLWGCLYLIYPRRPLLHRRCCWVQSWCRLIGLPPLCCLRWPLSAWRTEERICIKSAPSLQTPPTDSRAAHRSVDRQAR